MPNLQQTLTWSANTKSDGVIRLGKDKNGTKRIEKHIDNDGVNRTWYSRANGKLEYFEQFSAQSLLELERRYDRNGIESESAGYSDRGMATYKSYYDPNGNLIRQIKWADNGLPLQDTAFLNGCKHGTSTQYSAFTGHILSRIDYRYDKPDGLSEIYFDTPSEETIRSRMSYQDGREHGEYSIYYANGQLQESGELRAGQRTGVHKWFYENGQLKTLQRYVDGKLHGDIDEYAEGGWLRSRIGMKNGEKHGQDVSFNESGQMTGMSFYIEGKWVEDSEALAESAPADGVLQLFHDNGKPKALIPYLMGQPHGEFRRFDDESRLLEEGEYMHGQLNGRIRRYQENGLPADDTFYLNGIKSGKCTRYFENGQINTVDDFADDKIVASSKYYENGHLYWSRHFSAHGLCKLREYDDSGLLLLDAELQNNRWHGWVRGYLGDGSLSYAEQYKRGILEGECTHYAPNGKVRRKLFYLKGIVVESVYYNYFSAIVRMTTFHPDGSVISDEVFYPEPPETIEDDPAGFSPGSQVGDFEIIRTLGRGGMGEVYLARELSTQKLVAIKAILGKIDQKTLVRFLAEARALAKIKHENVISLISISNHAGTPYIVMEYVEGWTLASLLSTSLSVIEHLQIFKQMVLGVQAAHTAGILHRDLKPKNILVSEQFKVKVIDFGIARVPINMRLNVSTPAAIIGTIKYISPEVAVGQTATVQTDIYGLGLMLFEMLNGDAPFSGNIPADALEKIKSEDLRIPENMATTVDPKLVSLIKQMTTRNLADRLSNCAAVLQALESIDI